jgi:hypothetical protein
VSHIGTIVLRQAADFGVGFLLRGIAPAQQLMYLATAAGLIDAALLIALAAVPILANRHQPQSPPAL